MSDYFLLMHPRIIHFPIALFLAALGFELLSLASKKESFHKTALHMYVLGALIMPLVVRTGLWEEARLHLNHPVLTIHRILGLWSMWISLMTLPIIYFLRKMKPEVLRPIFLLFLLIMAVIIPVTAHNGGRMVYEYGVGVDN